MKLFNYRKFYKKDSLSINDVGDNPLEFFRRWFEDADNSDEIIESNEYLKNLLKEDILAFAHPQGGDNGKKNLYVQKVLRYLNYKICFNIIEK